MEDINKIQEPFDFEFEEIIKDIKKHKGVKKILIQLPEGLKQYAPEILNKLKSKLRNIEYIISGDSCWGGCDIAVNETKNLGADLLLHFGHSKFIKNNELNKNIIYIDIKDKTNLINLIKNSLLKLKDYKSIALVSSVQHLHKLEEIKEFYEKNNKKIKIPNAIGFADKGGHVTGCEYSGLKLLNTSNKIDCVVVIGNQFHGLGASLALINKDVFLIDTYNNKIVLMNDLRDKIIKQRAISIEKFKKTKKIGIIIESKLGQSFGSFEKLKSLFEKQGKQVILISMNEITPEKLFNFYSIDGFVELGCPRISIDDYERYLKSDLKKPVITFKEALVVLNQISWDVLLKKGIL